MKNSIKRLALLAIMIVASFQMKAQFHFGINAIGTMPMSHWAEKGAANFGTNPYKGNAFFGAGIGFRFQYDFSWRYNGIVSPFIDIDGLWNPRNKTMKDYFAPRSFTVGHFVNAPVMLGATYRYFFNYQRPIIGIFVEGAIGADLLYITQEGWENNPQTYKISPALAVRAGLGICLTPQLNIGVHYIFLGNHAIEKDKAGIYDPDVVLWLPEKLKENALMLKLTYIIKGNKLKHLPIKNSPL